MEATIHPLVFVDAAWTHLVFDLGFERTSFVPSLTLDDEEY
jgi:hypothetical protein